MSIPEDHLDSQKNFSLKKYYLNCDYIKLIKMNLYTSMKKNHTRIVENSGEEEKPENKFKIHNRSILSLALEAR